MMQYSRVVLSIVLAAQVFALTPAAAVAQDASPAKAVVVFVDLSGSVDADREQYKKDLQHVEDSIGRGDRLVVAGITADTLTKFDPAVDLTMPTATPPPPESTLDGLMANKLRKDRELKHRAEEDAKRLDAAKEKMHQEVSQFWSTAQHSKKTAILDCLAVSQKLFSEEHRRKVLVLISDMLEDSDRYTFEKLKLPQKTISEMVEKDRKSGLLPGLQGVRIYVAGASAASAEKAEEVEAFWTAYFKAAGADFAPAHYSHALINFSE